MKLKNYVPAGKQIIVHLKHYGQVGSIIMPDAQPDKIVRVLAVGDQCEKVKPGDYVLFDERAFLQMDMTDENGKDITVLFATEFAIMGYYTPDPDETRFYVPIKGKHGMGTNDTREMNIIDNPGIEASPYLKEEAENKKMLDDNS